jgi:deazaflavin-dependent oxidoreductase (nitroreductase family)
MHDVTAKYLSALHAGLYRVTGGRVGRRLVDNDMLLLTTIGRKSGRRHRVPLLYLRDGDTFVVIASWGGRDYPPDWYLNLMATPEVEVQVLAETIAAAAREATTAERKVWWPLVLEAYDGYSVYEGRTERTIPVVFLEPRT